MLPWQLPAHEDKGYTSSRARRRSEAMRADTQTQIHARLPARSSCVCQSTSPNMTVVRVCGTHYIYINSMHLRYVQFPSTTIFDACEGVKKLIELAKNMFRPHFTFKANIKKLFCIKKMKPVLGPNFLHCDIIFLIKQIFPQIVINVIINMKKKNYLNGKLFMHHNICCTDFNLFK